MRVQGLGFRVLLWYLGVQAGSGLAMIGFTSVAAASGGVSLQAAGCC